MIRGCLALFGVMVVPVVSLAQQPTGTIAGVVRDASNAAIRGVRVVATSRATRQVRTTATGSSGDYSLPALPSGEYDLLAEAAGFQRVTSLALVEAGTTTRADLVLPLPTVNEVVTVAAASPQMRYDSAAVSGLIVHDQIRGLPLNGRNFLQLASLEPGVQAPAPANRNRTLVSMLSAPALNVGGARYTVDGGSITAIALGGAQMALSPEQIAEFQVATVNVDLAAGITDSGAINIVTRSGTNTHQGSAFYFLRDHHLAAYPGLEPDPDDPNPFFRRHQFGGVMGGPVRRDRAFYFGNWERTDQQAVASTTVHAPDFAHLSRITASPFAGDLFSVRADIRVAAAHTAFVRYSRDMSDAFGPVAAVGGGSANAYPSNWNRVATDVSQAVTGLTSVLRSTLISDLRVSVFDVQSAIGSARDTDCDGCLGLGTPAITIAQLTIGNSMATDYRARRVHFAGGLTWQTGGHHVRAGVDWERNRDRNLIWSNEPVTLVLHSPEAVRAHNARPDLAPELRIPLPDAFTTIEDILQLPLQTIGIAVGDPRILQEGGRVSRQWDTVWLYAQDAWRSHPRLTVTYGLGWAFDGVLNNDLHKPNLLAPLLGADGLGPTRHNLTNFSPASGLVWTLSSDGNTVVRAAAGRYYRAHGLTSSMDTERAALGPPGGRQLFPGSAIPNPFADIPGVRPGAPLEFRGGPMRFTGADAMEMLPSKRAELLQALATADRSVAQIQITKQQALAAIFPEHVASPSALHVNAGVQRRLTKDTVLSADVVYRRFVDVPLAGGALDLNHFNRASGPVLPNCRTIEPVDSQTMCSRGQIMVYVAPFRFTYKGVLLRVERRVSSGLQLLGSYAYSRTGGTNTGNGFDLDNWLANTGPAANDLRHLANAAGVLRLPQRWELGFNFSYGSTPPFSAFVGQVIDFNGDGTSGDLLPGTTVNVFNRGMNRADLARLVDEFNARLAGTRDARGAPILALPALPPDYAFGDNFHMLDLRLTRSFDLGARARIALIVEVFNAYNAENLSGYSGDLTSAGFGRPTSRSTQVFGSGGPRSCQLATRVSF